MRFRFSGWLTLWFATLLMIFPSIVIVNAATERLEFTGSIANEAPFVEYKFIVDNDGSTVVVDITPVEGETGGDLDTYLYLLNENSEIVAENDDRKSGITSSRIEFPQAPVGEYTIIATRYGVLEGESQGEFNLWVEIIPPEDIVVRNYDYDISEDALLAAGYPATNPRPLADWTLLVYYGADTNLEGGIINDFIEFEASGGSNAEIRIIALMDRSPEYSKVAGDWMTARLFEISGTRQANFADPQLVSRQLAEFERVDSGDGLTLAQFLAWGVRNYPARNYAVSFGSHGAGWRGVITDYSESEREGEEESILTLPELRSAFSLGLQVAGTEKFSLMLNDACLMSSVEYHHVIADYFDYSISSPEIVVNPALDMTRFASAFRQDPQLDVRNLGKALIDQYIDVDVRKRPSSDIIYLTNALTDLSDYQTLYQKVEAFASLASSNIGNYATTIGAARRNTYTYSAYLGADELIDLGNFMTQIILNSDDPDLSLAAQEVLEALDAVYLYGRAGDLSAQKTTTYQNIYFPSSSDIFTTRYFEETTLGRWGQMLRGYYNAMTPNVWTIGADDISFHAPIAPVIRIYRVLPADEVTTFTAFSIRTEIIGRNIAYGDFIVDQLQADGSYLRLNNQRLLTDVVVDGRLERINRWFPGTNITDIFWDITVPLVTLGEQSNLELLRITEDLASLEGRYREPESERWNDVSILMSYDRVEGGIFQRAINRSPDSGAVGEITIPVGSEFQTYKQFVTPDGRTVRQEGNTYLWAETGPSWQWTPAPSGDYNIGFLMTSFGGTTSFASVPTSVNTEDADPNVRSLIRANLALTTSRPKDWPIQTFIPNLGVFRSQSPDALTHHTLFFITPGDAEVTQDVNDIIAKLETKYSALNLRAEASRTPIDLGLRQGLEFDVSYTEDGREYTGRGFAFWHQNTLIPFGMMAVAVSTDDAPIEYNVLRDYLVLLDVNAPAEGVEPALWLTLSNQETLPAMSFPMLISWSPAETLTDDIWTRFPQEANPDSPTFIALADIPADNPLFIAEDANTLLGNLLNEYVLAGGVTDLETESRRYTGELNTWNAVIYRGMRGETAVRGRVYVTYKNSQAYAVWMETPEGESAASIYYNNFEPIVDGINIAGP